MLFVVTASFADEAQIIIKQKSGDVTKLELSTHPTITFSWGNMVVSSDVISFSIPLDNIDSYTVSNETTGIPAVTTKPQFSRGHVVFSGLSKGAPVNVYSIDGKSVDKLVADDSGVADVSLESLPKGTYIISTPNNKIKVINK